MARTREEIEADLEALNDRRATLVDELSEVLASSRVAAFPAEAGARLNLAMRAALANGEYGSADVLVGPAVLRVEIVAYANEDGFDPEDYDLVEEAA